MVFSFAQFSYDYGRYSEDKEGNIYNRLYMKKGNWKWKSTALLTLTHENDSKNLYMEKKGRGSST